MQIFVLLPQFASFMHNLLVGKTKVSLFFLCGRPHGSLRTNDSVVVLGLDSASGSHDRKE